MIHVHPILARIMEPAAVALESLLAAVYPDTLVMIVARAPCQVGGLNETSWIYDRKKKKQLAAKYEGIG